MKDPIKKGHRVELWKECAVSDIAAVFNSQNGLTKLTSRLF
jgi:hypothetical protein